MKDIVRPEIVPILREMERLAEELSRGADPLLRSQAEFLHGRIVAMVAIAGGDLNPGGEPASGERELS